MDLVLPQQKEKEKRGEISNGPFSPSVVSPCRRLSSSCVRMAVKVARCWLAILMATSHHHHLAIGTLLMLFLAFACTRDLCCCCGDGKERCTRTTHKDDCGNNNKDKGQRGERRGREASASIAMQTFVRTHVMNGDNFDIRVNSRA